jgi:hypothetical protein
MISFNFRKMKRFYKILPVTLIIFLTAIPLLAQQQDAEPVIRNKEAMEKIQSARIALITSRLGLTPEQAQKFWPIYNEYLEKRRGLARELNQDRQTADPNKMTDRQSQQLMEQSMKIKQQMLDLEKDYSQRLQKVITNQQLLELRKAEQDFRRMIIERLQQRKMQQMRREQMMQRRDN